MKRSFKGLFVMLAAMAMLSSCSAVVSDGGKDSDGGDSKGRKEEKAKKKNNNLIPTLFVTGYTAIKKYRERNNDK